MIGMRAIVFLTICWALVDANCGNAPAEQAKLARWGVMNRM